MTKYEGPRFWVVVFGLIAVICAMWTVLLTATSHGSVYDLLINFLLIFGAFMLVFIPMAICVRTCARAEVFY